MAITDADPALVVKFKTMGQVATTMSNGVRPQTAHTYAVGPESSAGL